MIRQFRFVFIFIFLIVFTSVLGLASCTSLSTKTSSAVDAGLKAPVLVNAWLQWVPTATTGANSKTPQLEVRAVVSSSQCPELVTKNAKINMTPRATASTDFPFLICTGVVPSELAAANVDSKGTVTVRVVSAAETADVREIALQVPRRKMSKIVILGDSGCRLIAGKGDRPGAYQECNDSAAWPLKTVAESAAKWGPDLVIHLGDFHYREAACPEGNKGCEGSPFGYGWSAWDADFFTPAKSLLEASPWVFVRGNHESCARAGAGWFQFLDPFAVQPCSDKTQTYSLKFGTHELIVVDVSEAKNMPAEIGGIGPAEGYRWLLTHRPFLTQNQSPTQPSADILPEHLKKPGKLSLAMAGHVHTLSLNRFQDFRPPELIIGNGASALDPKTDFLIKKPGDEFYRENGFGFVTFEQVSLTNWKLQVHDIHGAVVKSCRIREFRSKKSELTCKG